MVDGDQISNPIERATSYHFSRSHLIHLRGTVSMCNHTAQHRTAQQKSHLPSHLKEKCSKGCGVRELRKGNDRCHCTRVGAVAKQ